MPLKKNHSTRNTVVIWTILIIIAVLMMISFSPVQHMTEIVLFS